MAAPSYSCRVCATTLLSSSSCFYLTSTCSFLCSQHASDLISPEYIYCDLLLDEVIQLFVYTENYIQTVRSKIQFHASLNPLSESLRTSLQIRVSEIQGSIYAYYEPPQSSPSQLQLPAQSAPQASANWQCSVCGHENFPDNKICWKCREPQGSQAKLPSSLDPAPLDIAIFADAPCDEAGIWTCPKESCKRRNTITNKKCECGYTNLGLVDLEIMEEVQPPVVVSSSGYQPTNVDNTPWTCGKCKYEYNMSFHEKCQKCETQNPRKAKKEESKAADVWACQNCKFAYNHSKYSDCQQCRANKSYVKGRRLEEVKEEAKVQQPVSMPCKCCNSIEPVETFVDGCCKSCFTILVQSQASRLQQESKYETCLTCGCSNLKSDPECRRCVTEGRKVCSLCKELHIVGNRKCRIPSAEVISAPVEEQKSEAILCSKCNNGPRENGALCSNCAKSSKADEQPPPTQPIKNMFCLTCKITNCGIHSPKQVAS